jgi:hypothetical protein
MLVAHGMTVLNASTIYLLLVRCAKNDISATYKLKWEKKAYTCEVLRATNNCAAREEQ